jgi:exodeoxyribonuclease V alpha subunit
MSVIDASLRPDPADQEQARDQFAVELALSAPEPLRTLNLAGTLEASDIHVARTLAKIAGVADEEVLLAVAMTVAAARAGHVFLDLAAAAASLDRDQDWIARVGNSTTLIDSTATGHAPLRLDGTRLYLDRYWREERRLAATLLARNRMRTDVGDLATIGNAVARLFPEGEEQRVAASVALLRDLTVIAGGPGTGKTTTVARIVELTQTLALEAGRPEPLIALCAPTGKAAARLQEASARAAPASTIHRLLGWLPGGRFRHDARNRLPHDLVIVDETSMVPLSLMLRLVEAVRDDAQLVLVGDPDQLVAIEVGAVLSDIVGPAADTPQFGPGMRAALQRVTGSPVESTSEERSFGDSVAVLRRGHRSVAQIGTLAAAIQRGDADAAVQALGSADPAITWLKDPENDLEPLREQAFAALAPMVTAARAGDAPTALRLLAGFRLLCAHRHGPYGVSHWTDLVESWLREGLAGFDPGAVRYAGLPLLVTRNDYELRLYNGDTGVIVAADTHGGSSRAVFDTSGGLVELAPSRLADVESLFATTVHKSQGSEFDVAALVLPEPESQLLTRELIYTAITRARRQIIVVGAEDSVRTAVARPAGRATGLRELLWTPQP